MTMLPTLSELADALTYDLPPSSGRREAWQSAVETAVSLLEPVWPQKTDDFYDADLPNTLPTVALVLYVDERAAEPGAGQAERLADRLRVVSADQYSELETFIRAGLELRGHSTEHAATDPLARLFLDLTAHRSGATHMELPGYLTLKDGPQLRWAAQDATFRIERLGSGGRAAS
ncbi:hypothetical protein ABZ726_01015 [Streptomyces hundungensis]|uniref:hypothetical protein n=1 Tax=Streptomyces hundungensis TaxID=1077946 RepID=UPI0033C6FCF1